MPEKFFHSARKKCPTHPTHKLLVKIPDFGHFISFNGMNSVFFRLINIKNVFFFFGCWFLPEKFRFCPKNNGFARVWGSPLARTPMKICVSLYRGGSTNLAAAIRVIRTQIFRGSSTSQRVAVIMVEGPSVNESEAVNEAILAREAGIQLLVVGVSRSGMPLTEWMGTASYPNKLNVFTVRDYDQLATIVNRLIASVNNGNLYVPAYLHSLLIPTLHKPAP